MEKEEIEYNYQLFNTRILFFVFLNFFWLFINNSIVHHILKGETGVFVYIVFFLGLFLLDTYFFKLSAKLFKRKGKIVLDSNMVIFSFKNHTKKIEKNKILDVTYNIYNPINACLGAISLKDNGKEFKIYFEDLNDENKLFYQSVFEKIKKACLM